MRDERSEPAEEHLVRFAEGHPGREVRPDDGVQRMLGPRPDHLDHHGLTEAVADDRVLVLADGGLDRLAERDLRART